MPSGLRRFVWLVSLGSVVAAIAVPVAGGGFYTPVGGACVNTGQAFVSGSNSWTVNAVNIPYFCSGTGSAWVELYYIRPNGSQYTPALFLYQGGINPVEFVDPRDISYGKAVCRNGGWNAMWFKHCWAS